MWLKVGVLGAGPGSCAVLISQTGEAGHVPAPRGGGDVWCLLPKAIKLEK